VEQLILLVFKAQLALLALKALLDLLALEVEVQDLELLAQRVLQVQWLEQIRKLFIIMVVLLRVLQILCLMEIR
jgi:hypothetical protein